MRKLILIGLLSIALPSFADTAAQAPTDTASADTTTKALKIGVVDVRKIVQQSPQLQVINGQLVKKFKPREQEIVRTQAKFKAAQDQYAKEAPNLSEAERTKREHGLLTDRANLQAMITTFQQDLDSEQNGAMQKLLTEIAGLVDEMAQSEHYDVILQGDSVPYVTAQLNITDTVLKKLSKK